MCEENKKWCVYMHTNKINDKKYIGISSNVKERWRSNGILYKGQKIFSDALKKYGWDNFTHEIIYNDLTREQAGEIEKFLINRYKTTDRKNGYNYATGGFGGGSNGRYKATPYTKEVYQYSIDGHFIKKYVSIAAAVHDILHTDSYRNYDISRCCSGKRDTALGYRWFYNYMGEQIEPLKPLINRRCDSQKIKIYQYSLQGDYIQSYDSISEAQAIYGAAISHCLNGRANTAYDYQWFKEYKGLKVEPKLSKLEQRSVAMRKPKKPVYQYSADGVFICKYNDRQEAAKKYGVSAIKTYETVSNKCAGYIWSNNYYPDGYKI